MSTVSAQTLQKFLDSHLPLTQFMGMDVESYDGKTLILSAPLEPNINDKLTAFGGSLYNIAVMACWGMAYLKTQEAGLDCNQVVSKANIEYKSPVRGHLRAICRAPDNQSINEFIESFKTRGKAKIKLSSTIECSGNLAVEFTGEYAILKH